MGARDRWRQAGVACLLVALISAVGMGLAVPAGSADDPVSAEHPVTSTVLADDVDPVVASDGTTALAVWVNKRSSFAPAGVFASRIDGEGARLDGQGVRIADAHHVMSPAVAWNGSRYLVVWWSPGNAPALRGALVTPGGAVGAPFQIAASSVSSDVSISSSGDLFLVTWRTCGGEFCRLPPFGLRAARVSGEGVVLDPSGLPVASTSQLLPATTSGDGEDFLVLWQNGSISGARITARGNVSAPFEVVPAAEQPTLDDLAWGNGSYVVVYEKDGGVHGKRLTRAGASLDATAFPISTGTSNTGAAVSWDSGVWLVAWLRDRSVSCVCDDIIGARVDDDGAVLDAQPVTISSDDAAERRPDVGAGPTTELTVVYKRSGSAFLRFVSAK